MINKASSIEQYKIKTLYVFVFLLPYQSLNIFDSVYFNYTWIGYFLYLIINMITFKKSFNINKNILKFVLPIFLYWCLTIIMNYIYYEPEATIIYAEIRQELMGIVFLWIIINNLKGNYYQQQLVLNIFLYSICLMAILYIAGVGVNYDKDGRLTILATSSNLISFWVSIATIILISNILKYKIQDNLYIIKLIISIIFVIILLIIIANTGSRGGLVSFSIGYIIYFLTIKEKILTKLYIGLLSILIGIFALNAIVNSSVMRDRIIQQSEDNSFGGRMPIWETTIGLIKENPIFGVGPGKYEMRFVETGKFMATHNEYLTVLVYTGILGLSMVLLFNYQLFKGIIQTRHKQMSPLLYALFSMNLVYFFSAGGALPSLTTWFIFGLIASNGIIFKKKFYNNKKTIFRETIK